MSSSDVFTRAFEAIQRRFVLTVEDATPEQLSYQPHPEANSLAWLAWHLTRWQDTQVSRFAGLDQAWVSGWAAKFDHPSDASDTGLGHTSTQVSEFRADARLLLGYHQAVYERTLEYLQRVTEADLDQEVQEPRGVDTIRGRLVGVLSDNFQHVGQMAYLRGLLAGEHWGAH